MGDVPHVSCQKLGCQAWALVPEVQKAEADRDAALLLVGRLREMLRRTAVRQIGMSRTCVLCLMIWSVNDPDSHGATCLLASAGDGGRGGADRRAGEGEGNA